MITSYLILAISALTIAVPTIHQVSFCGWNPDSPQCNSYSGMVQKAYADPWSWGKSPSKGWLNCYNSGSDDCTNAR